MSSAFSSFVSGDRMGDSVLKQLFQGKHKHSKMQTSHRCCIHINESRKCPCSQDGVATVENALLRLLAASLLHRTVQRVPLPSQPWSPYPGLASRAVARGDIVPAGVFHWSKPLESLPLEVLATVEEWKLTVGPTEKKQKQNKTKYPEWMTMFSNMSKSWDIFFQWRWADHTHRTKFCSLLYFEYLKPGIDKYVCFCSVSVYYISRSWDPENLNDLLVVTQPVRDRAGIRAKSPMSFPFCCITMPTQLFIWICF